MLKASSINEFSIIKCIGEGAYSEVYLCKHLATKKIYKLLKTNIVARKVLELIDHPSFCKYYGGFDDEKHIYYIFDYYKNGTLFNELQRGKTIELHLLKQYALEIIAGLNHLRKKKVVHRDLKPENILLTDDKKHIKIIDFGTCKLRNNQNKEGLNDLKTRTFSKSTFTGTAQYISPELINDQKSGYASDLWSFGIILYRCLTGKYPFQSKSPYLLFNAICKGKACYPCDIDPDVKDLIQKLLKVNPRERIGFNSIKQLIDHKFFSGISFNDTCMLDYSQTEDNLETDTKKKKNIKKVNSSSKVIIYQNLSSKSVTLPTIKKKTNIKKKKVKKIKKGNSSTNITSKKKNIKKKDNHDDLKKNKKDKKSGKGNKSSNKSNKVKKKKRKTLNFSGFEINKPLASFTIAGGSLKESDIDLFRKLKNNLINPTNNNSVKNMKITIKEQAEYIEKFKKFIKIAIEEKQELETENINLKSNISTLKSEIINYKKEIEILKDDNESYLKKISRFGTEKQLMFRKVNDSEDEEKKKLKLEIERLKIEIEKIERLNKEENTKLRIENENLKTNVLTTNSNNNHQKLLEKLKSQTINSFDNFMNDARKNLEKVFLN